MGLHELALLLLLLVIIAVFVLWLMKQLAGPVALIIGFIVIAIFLLVGAPLR